ncbi:MAG: hypothetical protein Q7S84_04980 [bacterium]|nr:hypothetical protein [bacterium]
MNNVQMTTVDVDREERGLYANADPEELEDDLADTVVSTEEPSEPPLFEDETEEAQ